MVEAEVVERQLLARPPERAGDAPAQPRRRNADADPRSPSTRWAASVTIPAGLVKFIEPAVRRPRGHRLGEPTIAGIVRRRKADAARAGGVVRAPEAQRDRLVDDAALEPAGPDRAEDEVGALDGVLERRGGAEGQPLAGLGGLALSTRRCAPAARVEVVQDDLVEAERRPAL